MTFTPYSFANTIPDKYRSYIVGAERLVEQLRTATLNAPGMFESATSFPPYNIIKLSEFEYTVELAIAGYEAESIGVETAEGVLTIKSDGTPETRPEGDEYPKFIHRGLARRSFTRQFVLVETMEVTNVELEGGILKIKIVNRLPEHKHPKKFEIAVKKTASKK